MATAVPRSRRSCSHARAPTRSRRSTDRGTGRRRRWRSAPSILCTVLWDQESPLTMALWLARDPREPGVARPARPRVSPRRARRRRSAALGTLLGDRLGARRRAVGSRRDRDVSRVAAAPGAADRLPLQRGPRRPQPHRGLQAAFYGFALAALVPLIARVASRATRCICSPRSCFWSCSYSCFASATS